MASGTALPSLERGPPPNGSRWHLGLQTTLRQDRGKKQRRKKAQGEYDCHLRKVP